MNKKQKKLQALQNDYDLCTHQLEIAQDNLDMYINGDLDHSLGLDHLKAVRNKWRGDLVKIKEQMMELDESLRPPRLPSDDDRLNERHEQEVRNRRYEEVDTDE